MPLLGFNACISWPSALIVMFQIIPLIFNSLKKPISNMLALACCAFLVKTRIIQERHFLFSIITYAAFHFNSISNNLWLKLRKPPSKWPKLLHFDIGGPYRNAPGIRPHELASINVVLFYQKKKKQKHIAFCSNANIQWCNHYCLSVHNVQRRHSTKSSNFMRACPEIGCERCTTLSLFID